MIRRAVRHDRREPEPLRRPHERSAPSAAEWLAAALDARPRLRVLALDLLGTAAACAVGALGLAVYEALLVGA